MGILSFIDAVEKLFLNMENKVLPPSCGKLGKAKSLWLLDPKLLHQKTQIKKKNMVSEFGVCPAGFR